ncbi:MAG TPA: penicillin-binding transpeptidase domain-containing protein [Pyrinomonadaceae bacterium]|nr:penicillin-binding transpeptidase domain-containing protein [Pyrinomonadaceae bacterium]
MTTLAFFFFQTPTPSATPPTPEKLPAWLTLIYLIGIGVVGLLLLLSLLRAWLSRSPSAPTAPANLPKDVRDRLGATATNRGLRVWRWLFALVAIFIFGFHVYWARYAADRNPKFQEMTYKDLRNRRLSESTLRGWIYDRKGRPLAYYKKNNQGEIDREYPMDAALAHIFGSDRGEPGLERALFGTESGAVPEISQIIRGETVQQKLNKDYKLTIDMDLQQAVVDQLKGNHGAVAMFNPQTGEVLALYSNPSYSLRAVDEETTWLKLDNDRKEKPLLNRALREYYVPGSTFKTVMMYTAFRNNMQDTRFTTSGGFTPPGCGRTITDDNGGCEACGNIGIDSAYQHSSNIYFSYLGTQLGGEKIRDTARLLGLGAYDSVSGEGQGRREPEIWNASSKAIQNAMAPTESWLKAGPHSTRCELMYEGYGQGYASQMTPFQMAMIISAAANLNGQLMKPKIEADLAPQTFSQVLTPSQAAEIRHIMNMVTEGGTGTGAMAPVRAAGIRSGGKTGTAQKAVPVIDPKTGEPQKKLVTEHDFKGNIIGQHYETVFYDKLRSDAWYLSFAPLDKPVIAMAVLLEGPGPGISFYGGKNAAPIAAQLILKANSLGYFGGNANQQSQQRQPAATPSPRRRPTP